MPVICSSVPETMLRRFWRFCFFDVFRSRLKSKTSVYDLQHLATDTATTTQWVSEDSDRLASTELACQLVVDSDEGNKPFILLTSFMLFHSFWWIRLDRQERDCWRNSVVNIQRALIKPKNLMIACFPKLYLTRKMIDNRTILDRFSKRKGHVSCTGMPVKTTGKTGGPAE